MSNEIIQSVQGCCPDGSPWGGKSVGRLDVVTHVYHQLPGGNPVELHSPPSSRPCGTSQPTIVRLTVGEDWVDMPWAAHLVVVNEEGRSLQRVPTAEQAEAIAAKVVEIGAGKGGPALLVRPGVSQPLEPAGDLFLRCRKGAARVTVTRID